jgi:hypothetical protein
MMQLIMYNGWSDTTYSRDYLQQQLQHALIAGHHYQVSFYTVTEEINTYAINNIGAYFDDGTIDTTSHPAWTQCQYTAQIVDTNIINDTVSWHKIEGVFMANGTEQFMTIGNFTDIDHTKRVVLIPGAPYTAQYAWYLVDDVSVIDCDNIPFAGHDTVLMHIGDSAFIGPHDEALPYTWYVLGSTSPIDSGGGIWVHPTATTTYVLEQLLCGTTRFDTIKVLVWPDTVLAAPRPAPRGREVACWPNPAGDELNVSGAKDCVVELVDVVGRIVITNTPTTEKTLIDVSKLPPGTYFVKVTEPVTGSCVTKRLVKD